MTRLLVMTASLGLSLSAAGACEFMKSAEAKVDQTIVSSVTANEKSMSTPQQVIVVDEAASGKTVAEKAAQ